MPSFSLAHLLLATYLSLLLSPSAVRIPPPRWILIALGLPRPPLPCTGLHSPPAFSVNFCSPHAPLSAALWSLRTCHLCGPGPRFGLRLFIKQWASRRFRGLACTQAVVFMTPEQKMHRADIQSGHSPPRRFASSTPPTEIPGHAAAGGRPRRHLRLRASAFDPCHLRARRALHVHEHGGEPTFGLQEAKRTRRKLEEDGMICPCTFAHTLPRLRAPVENGPGCDRQAWVALTGHKNIFRSLPST